MSESNCKCCYNARKHFRVGDKVVLSVDGCTQLPEFIMHKSHGIVVGFSRSFNCMRIKFPNLVKPQTLHCGFFERM